MILTMAQADAEMADLFRQSWEVDAGYVCDWPNTKANDHEEDATWARWSLDYVGGRQATLNKKGSRKFEKRGLIYINVFSHLEQAWKMPGMLLRLP